MTPSELFTMAGMAFLGAFLGALLMPIAMDALLRVRGVDRD